MNRQILTVIIRDESSLRYVNEPVTYRTVHVELTEAQMALLSLRNDNEAVSSVFLEPRDADSTLHVPRKEPR